MPDGKEYKYGGLYWSHNMLPNCGYKQYGDLYNHRMKLFFTLYMKVLHELYNEMIKSGEEKEYIKAIITYLGLIQDRLAARGQSRTSLWKPGDRTTVSGMTGSAIKKVVNYCEVNPFDKAGLYTKTKETCGGISAAIPVQYPVKQITRSSATKLPYNNNYFDAIFTDPPYYDFVPYADHSDFYYVWLKRSIGWLYPKEFAFNLTPKSQEAVSNASRQRGGLQEEKDEIKTKLKTNAYFETMMEKSLNEMYRVLKPDGIINVVYAHTTLVGWETLINALRKSGFVVTAAWPISTETQGRMSALNTASMQKTIYMTARKYSKTDHILYNDIKDEIISQIDKKIEILEDESSFSDLQIIAIGYALHSLTKYENITKVSGEYVSIGKLLEDIRHHIANTIINKILEVDIPSDDFIWPFIMYRLSNGNRWSSYDDTRLLFMGSGNTIQDLGDFIKRKGSKVYFKTPSDFKEPLEDTDRLSTIYNGIILRKKNMADECYKMIEKLGYNEPSFWNIIQNIGLKLHDKDMINLYDGHNLRNIPSIVSQKQMRLKY